MVCLEGLIRGFDQRVLSNFDVGFDSGFDAGFDSGSEFGFDLRLVLQNILLVSGQYLN